MIVLGIYALAVFAFSLGCFLLWRRWYWAIGVVVLATVLGTLVMRSTATWTMPTRAEAEAGPREGH